MTSWLCRILAFVLITCAAGLRIAYFMNDCPLDLAPDEAHYWDWSRHLDWSYYSKGPAVAVLIRGSCLLAGDWSQQVIGSEMIAVRLPALLCGSLLLAGLYVLTTLVHHDERLALAVVAIGLTLPLIAAGSSLMTIDAPYTCLWSWAVVSGYLACFRNMKWAWPTTGLLVGCGILAKYTMVLWLPSFALFLVSTPGFRQHFRNPGLWSAVGLAAACCVPILVWNMQHDWVTLKHLGGHAGLSSRHMVHLLGPVNYLGTQFGLFLGFWFVIWLAAMVQFAPWRKPNSEFAYLWWLSAPMFLVFLLFSLKNGGGEANWPATAYISGLVLAAGWWMQRLRSPRATVRVLVVIATVLFCVLGLAATLCIHHMRLARPLLARLVRPASETNPMPMRRIDPTCRLRGWQYLASTVDRLRDQLRAEGIEPIIAGNSWSLPGILGFYCSGQPTVYSLGLAAGDRHSQYDFWHPNPIDDAAEFHGRTFIVVGAMPHICEAFVDVEPAQMVIYREGEHAIASWTVTICRHFRGFSKAASNARY